MNFSRRKLANAIAAVAGLDADVGFIDEFHWLGKIKPKSGRKLQITPDGQT